MTVIKQQARAMIDFPSEVKPMQFSLRSVLGLIAICGALMALPRWIGPAPTGFLIGAITAAFLVWRFGTRGFFAGLFAAWLCTSLGLNIELAGQPAEDRVIAGLGTPSSPGVEILGIWLVGLIASFTYLAPIYLARAIRDFYRIRRRLPRRVAAPML